MFNGNIIIFGDSIAAWNPRKDFVNNGVPGMTTNNLYFNLKKYNFSNRNNDIAIIVCGVNDILLSIDEKLIYENICFIVKKISEHFYNVIFVSLLPTDSEKLNKNIVKLNEMLKISLQDKFLDMYRYFLANRLNTIDNIYTTDGIHLGNLGYKKFNEILDLKLEKIKNPTLL